MMLLRFYVSCLLRFFAGKFTMFFFLRCAQYLVPSLMESCQCITAFVPSIEAFAFANEPSYGKSSLIGVVV